MFVTTLLAQTNTSPRRYCRLLFDYKQQANKHRVYTLCPAGGGNTLLLHDSVEEEKKTKKKKRSSGAAAGIRQTHTHVTPRSEPFIDYLFFGSFYTKPHSKSVDFKITFLCVGPQNIVPSCQFTCGPAENSEPESHVTYCFTQTQLSTYWGKCIITT